MTQTTQAPDPVTAGRPPTAGQRELACLLLEQQERRSDFAELGTYVYSSEAHYAAEREHLFRKLPVLVGPSQMLPEPGSVVAHSEYGVPLLLTRDEKGRVRAMLNTCRHRGAQLIDSREPVQQSRITCPFHAWAYRLDGALYALPFPKTFSCLEKEKFGLLQFPTYEAGGLIWVKLDLDGDDDFSSVQAELTEDFDALGFRQMHLYNRKTHEVEANWKFILDGFQELYHVQVLHSDSVAKMFANAITTENPIGHHMRFATARKHYRELDVNGNIDHLNKYITYSYLVFPNTIVVVSPTFVNILIMYPHAAGRTMLDDYMLINKAPETEAEHLHWKKSWELLDGNVYEGEDLYAAQLLQKGLASGMLKTIVIGGLEMPIKTFHDHLHSYLPAESPTEAITKEKHP